MATDHDAPTEAVLHTALALPGRRSGKVRDLYEIPASGGRPARLLIVATDRLSAFDVVLPTPLPGKGRILTDMAVFWMRFVESRGLCPTHLISADDAEIPDDAFAPASGGGLAGSTPRRSLRGRIMIARRCRVVPVECVVRGYLEGSGWKEYRAGGTVCGLPLPSGLEQCARLPQPIFTPATKEEVGTHDQNISFDGAVAHLSRAGWSEPERLMTRLRGLSLAIYNAAAAHALARGIIIADTKFEFGVPLDTGPDDAADGVMLIDEALTPDSSRFWPADEHRPGRAQRSYDKQFVREYLEGLVAAGRWDRSAPGPELPEEIVRLTLERYRQARNRLTGMSSTGAGRA